MSAEEMGRVAVDQVGRSHWIVELHGEHDASNVDDLRAKLDAVFATGTSVIVDLSAATFIDSAIMHRMVGRRRGHVDR